MRPELAAPAVESSQPTSPTAGEGAANGSAVEPTPAIDPETLRAFRVAEALKAHSRGWPLTPLEGKVPTTKGWQSAAPPGPAEVEQRAREGNLGLRTGEASGVVVIDDDTPDGSGAASLALPRTITAVTGSGRWHYYFRRPVGGIGNSTGRLASRVDVKGDGGQVVFVGSLHPRTGRPYLWAVGLSPDEVELADLPAHIVQRLCAPIRPRPPTPPPPRPPGSSTPAILPLPIPRPVAMTLRHRRYAGGVLRNACARIAAASEGERNNTLNRQAYKVGQYVKFLDEQEALQLLFAAARAAGLEDGEIWPTLQSGFTSGANFTVTPEQVQRRLRSNRKRGKVKGPEPPPDRDPVEAAAADGQVVVWLRAGAMPQSIDAAEAALARHEESKGRARELFNRGTTLVQRVTTTDGAATTMPIGKDALRERMGRSGLFLREDRNAEWQPVDFPRDYAMAYLERGEWSIPRLAGISRTPVLLIDGHLVVERGYDIQSGIFLDLPGERWSVPIPEQPTRDDALSALARLLDALKDFPWVSPSHLSVALAAILTVLGRNLFAHAPLFAFSANTRGTGKSSLAEAPAIIGTGKRASMLDLADEREMAKALHAFLLESVQVLCIDNIDTELKSAALCIALTQATMHRRILGVSATGAASTGGTTFMCTGNNLTAGGDVTRRMVLCELDAGIERPDERVFDRDFIPWVQEHREELVAAGLTVLRAFLLAGCPPPDGGMTPFGGFEGWSRVIRGALLWVGQADPCESREDIMNDDSEAEDLYRLLVALQGAFGANSFLAREVCVTNNAVLGSVVYELLGTDGMGKARVVGRFLRKQRGRIVGGLRLVVAGDRARAKLWRVEEIARPTGDGPAVQSEFVEFRISENAQTHRAESWLAGPGGGVC